MHDPAELILVSVDDHICEPATMFDAHVPAKYRDHAPRVVDRDNGSQQWRYGDIWGRNLGLNAVAGKPPEYFNVDPLRYEHMRPGHIGVKIFALAFAVLLSAAMCAFSLTLRKRFASSIRTI